VPATNATQVPLTPAHGSATVPELPELPVLPEPDDPLPVLPEPDDPLPVLPEPDDPLELLDALELPDPELPPEPLLELDPESPLHAANDKAAMATPSIFKRM